MKIILILLEKAEQILSIINLPDSAIAKYNTLKELSFDKIGLDYKPLAKRMSMVNNNNNINNNKSHQQQQQQQQYPQSPSVNNSIVSDLSTINHNNNHNNLSQSSTTILNKMKSLTIKKNMIIEFLFDLIEKQKMETVHMYRNQLQKDAKQFQSFYDQILSFKNSSTIQSPEDDDFDIKIDEIKLNDYITKLDIVFKLFNTSLKKSNSEYSNSSYTNNDFENIIQNYNKKIEDIKQLHRNELLQYEKKYEMLKEKYNPVIAEDLAKIKRRVETIEEMLMPIYEKYSKKKISVYEPNKSLLIDKEDSLIQIVNFTVCFIEQLFKDNKHLIETITSIEKEKQDIIEDLNLPYVAYSIKKNKLIKDIASNTTKTITVTEGIEMQLDNMISLLTSSLNDNVNYNNDTTNKNKT